MKFTKLEDEILSFFSGDADDMKLSARQLYEHCTLAVDEKEVCVALNAMVKRGDIVWGKDKLYSVAYKKAPDVVVESSETKKEEPVLTNLNYSQKIEIDLLKENAELAREVTYAYARATGDRLIIPLLIRQRDAALEALEAFRKAVNAPG